MSNLEFSPAYLNKLQQLNIRMRRLSLGSQSGIHKSLRKGHGLEFSDLRPYSPGDDFRAIDWNALARTDKLYTRQYREEQDLKILVVHDLSESLAPFEISKYITLSICYVGLCSGDQISLLLPNIDQFPWVRSASSFKKLIQFLNKSTPSKETDLSKSIMQATSNLKIPARLYIVSDFLYPLEQLQFALEYATNKNFEISIIIIDNMNFEGAPKDAIFVDSETNREFDFDLSDPATKIAIETHHSKIIEIAKYYGQQYVIIKHSEEIEDVIFKKFIETKLLR